MSTVEKESRANWTSHSNASVRSTLLMQRSTQRKPNFISSCQPMASAFPNRQSELRCCNRRTSRAVSASITGSVYRYGLRLRCDTYVTLTVKAFPVSKFW